MRLLALGLLVLGAMSTLVARLWEVQVIQGDEYAAKVRRASQITVRIPSVRGEIRDRNGLPLVVNRASYEVDFHLPDMVSGYRERYGSTPQFEFQRTVRGNLENAKETDIIKIVNEEVLPRLIDLELARPYNSENLRRHFRNDTQVPFTYMEDIDFETLARFAEHDVGLPGVDLTLKPVRHYLYGAFASHILGYVGAPRDVDRVDAQNFTFYQSDVEGKAQIELHMDEYLRGKPGVRVLQRDPKGVVEGEVEFIPPTPGDNVYLTIDARIQAIAEEAMRSVGRGAAVVVDPNNGDVLAMVSVPSYDPNTFIPSISVSDWTTLMDDGTDPLTNRAVSGYAPGSTYKIPIALAGMTGSLGANSTFTCTGGVQYGNKFMRCWIHGKGSHGSINLSQAIKVSCNAYFYLYGNKAGIDSIVAVGNILGLGQRSGMEITGESPGILPGPEWLAENLPRERWSSGFTANTSIGQGFVLASPLQMAMLTATVANGGVSYYPRIVDRVLSHDGEVTRQQPARRRGDLKDNGVTEDQIESIRRGMWRVVNEDGGTARRARIKDNEVAGKTGTAQFWRGGVKDNHTWFIAFAPYENPKYAVCVFVQGAEAGGAVSAPIVAKILEEAFELDGQEPEAYTLAKLDPAPGNFEYVASIDFGRAIPAALTSAPTDVSSDIVTAPSSPPQTQRVTARPNVRPEADQVGSQQIQERRPNILRRIFRRR